MRAQPQLVLELLTAAARGGHAHGQCRVPLGLLSTTSDHVVLGGLLAKRFYGGGNVLRERHLHLDLCHRVHAPNRRVADGIRGEVSFGITSRAPSASRMKV